MAIRGYQEYHMLVLSTSQYAWGGSDYTHVALDPNVTIPSGVSTSATTSISHTTGSEVDATGSKSFILPSVFDVVTILDGTVRGTIKLAAEVVGAGDAGDYIDITKVELTMNAIDTSGSSRVIAAKQEIWTGSVKATGSGTTTEQFMWWAEVADVVMEANERMTLEYTITYTAFDGDADRTLKASLYCTKDTDEMTATLPFVM